MKRSILCHECVERRGVDPCKQITSLEAAERAREHRSCVFGHALGSGYCDVCGCQFDEGDGVWAESITLNRDELKWSWWRDYIELEAPND